MRVGNYRSLIAIRVSFISQSDSRMIVAGGLRDVDQNLPAIHVSNFYIRLVLVAVNLLAIRATFCLLYPPHTTVRILQLMKA